MSEIKRQRENKDTKREAKESITKSANQRMYQIREKEQERHAIKKEEKEKRERTRKNKTDKRKYRQGRELGSVTK